MFVPWLLYCCLTLVKDGRLSWLVVPALILIVESHSAIGLVSIVVLVATGVVFVGYHGLTGLRSVAKRLVLAAAATALILMPLFIAELRMGKYYDPITVITDETGPFPHNFSRPLSYLIDPSYHWLSRSNSEFVPVQLDFPITALLVIGLVTTIYLWATRGRSRPRTAVPSVNRPVITLLVSSLALYLLLQIPLHHPSLRCPLRREGHRLPVSDDDLHCPSRPHPGHRGGGRVPAGVPCPLAGGLGSGSGGAGRRLAAHLRPALTGHRPRATSGQRHHLPLQPVSAR